MKSQYFLKRNRKFFLPITKKNYSGHEFYYNGILGHLRLNFIKINIVLLYVFRRIINCGANYTVQTVVAVANDCKIWDRDNTNRTVHRYKLQVNIFRMMNNNRLPRSVIVYRLNTCINNVRVTTLASLNFSNAVPISSHTIDVYWYWHTHT